MKKVQAIRWLIEIILSPRKMLDRRSLTSATTIDGDNGLLETHVGDKLLPFTYRRVNSIDQGLIEDY